ncbi:MAG: pinensin family lanthipeptide [Luteibaculum sp.]
MKKKLNLSGLRVQSFVTELRNNEASSIKGQGTGLPTDITGASCAEDYVSCNPWECLATKAGDRIDCTKILD